MAIPSLLGTYIDETYQRLVQTNNYRNEFADGLGNPIPFLTNNTATGSYGSFYDTGSHTATSATAIYSMSLSTTDISNGVYISGSSNPYNTYIKFTNAGVYNIQFSAQFANSGNNPADVTIWLRKDDNSSVNDLADTAGICTIPAKKGAIPGALISSWNYFITAAPNDFFQLLWKTDVANDITLQTLAAGTNPIHPRTPSLIVTANRVDQFLSNTGSFSGSFTGQLIGTASWANNAQTASYVTASNVIGTVVSASHALTASYVMNASSLSGGTDRYIPLWSGSNALTTSSIYQNSNGDVDIAITRPHGYLQLGSSGFGEAQTYIQTSYGNSIIANNIKLEASDIWKYAREDNGFGNGGSVIQLDPGQGQMIFYTAPSGVSGSTVPLSERIRISPNGGTTITAPIVLPALNKAGNIAHSLTGRAQSIWAQQGYVFALDYINKTISVWRQDANYVLTNVINNQDLTTDISSIGSGPQQIIGDGSKLYISCYGGSISKFNFNTGTETLSLVAEDNTYFSSYFGQIWTDGTYIYSATANGSAGNNATLKVQSNSFATTYEYTTQQFGQSTQVYAIDQHYIFTANGGNNPGIRSFDFDGSTISVVSQNTTDYGNISSIHSDGTYVYFVTTGVSNNKSLLYAVDKDNVNTVFYVDITPEFGGAYIKTVWCDDTGKIWVSDGDNNSYNKVLAYTFSGTTFTKVSSTSFISEQPVQIVNTMTEYYVLTDTNIWVNSKTLTLQTYGVALTATGSVIFSLTSQPQNNVVTIDTATGQLYYTASSAFGGGSSSPAFPYSGSAVITGSLTVSGSSTFTNIGPAIFSGSLALVNGATGSLQGTASWAIDFVSASNYVLNSATSSMTVGTASISLYPISITGSTIYSTGPSTNNISANSSIFLGLSAGGGALKADSSIFLGQNAGSSATSASEAVIIGPLAGMSAAKANGSIFLGSGAGQYAVSASYSTLIGYYAGSSADSAGSGSIGTNNIVIGNNITLPSKSRNAINIGAIIFATGSYSLLGAGNLFSGSVMGRVGINVSTPQYNLDVSGSGNYSNGLTITGSLIAPTITGSLQGTASWAVDFVSASNYVLNSVTSSFLTTSSFNNYTSSIVTTSSFNAYTSSVLSTSSFNSFTSSVVSTSSFNSYTSSVLYTSSFNSFTSSILTTSSFNTWTGSVGSQFAGTASYTTGSIYNSSNPALSASYAQTSSYSLNGGVTQIIAGTNITLSPSNGLGAVTISSTGGSGGGTGANISQSFTNQSTWTFAHGLGVQGVIIQTYDSDWNQIIPQNIASTNTTTATITFPTNESGWAVASLGGSTTTAQTASYVTPYEGAWTSYIPSWTSAGTQPSLGNGTLTGAYKRIGKTVFVRVRLAFGTTTSGGTGAWQFGLPVTASIAAGIQFPCSLLDNGNAWYQAVVNGEYAGDTWRSALIAQSAGGANSSQGVDATFPFTWGNADSLQFNGSYESA